MIRLISGSTRIGSKVVTPDYGVFLTDKTTESRLVSLGVAEFVDMEVATPVIGANEDETGDNKSGHEMPSENDSEGDIGTAGYGVNSTVAELRRIAKENGITFEAGATKEDMVKALDEFFSNVPALDVEEPIE